MCQCSSKEKPVALRPHHGMCLAYFVGKGYSDGFTIHMERKEKEEEKRKDGRVILHERQRRYE